MYPAFNAYVRAWGAFVDWGGSQVAFSPTPHPLEEISNTALHTVYMHMLCRMHSQSHTLTHYCSAPSALLRGRRVLTRYMEDRFPASSPPSSSWRPTGCTTNPATVTSIVLSRSYCSCSRTVCWASPTLFPMACSTPSPGETSRPTRMRGVIVKLCGYLCIVLLTFHMML